MIKTSTKWWKSDYVVDIKVHVFFLIKASGQNIELRVKLSCSLWNVNEDFPFKGFQSTEDQVVMYELFIGCI